MSFNEKLKNAKKRKNDEFYTRIIDIEKEISAYVKFNPNVFAGKTILLPCDDPEWSNFVKYFIENFNDFKLGKLICTSYSGNSPAEQNTRKGKVFILSSKTEADMVKQSNIIKWEYLNSDGDFRNDEITKFRDESDIIITNPPFSLFRDFLSWITEADKKFIIIGNKNCVTYKEVFPLVKNNLMWSGFTKWSGGMWFETKNNDDVDKVIDGINMKNISSIWLTNIEHGSRYNTISLSSMNEILYSSKTKKINSKDSYNQYDNYNAIEISFTKFIPSDYNGIMGVPISFLDKYCPRQFEIIGATESEGKGFSNGLWDETSKIAQPLIQGKKLYKRIFIKHKREIAV